MRVYIKVDENWWSAMKRDESYHSGPSHGLNSHSTVKHNHH